MQFAYPQGRYYLLLAFAAAALAVLELVRKRRALRRLARQGIHQSGMLLRPNRQIFKCILLVSAAVLLGIAVLGPQWGWTEEEIPPRRGRDVLILLDVSRSMLAEDVAPNRLERAKADLRDLAGFLERAGGYRIGLIAFAERAAMMCPLTSDYRCFVEELADASLNSLRIRGRAAWGDGTQIRLALERAGQTIDDANAAYTDILLASDGEDMAHETLKTAESLARRGVTVHTLGLGDPTHDSLIPVRDSLGRSAHLRYRGELVHTHLQETVLKAIAETTHGRYFAAQTSYRDLDRQFGEMLSAKKSLQRQTVHHLRRGVHRFAWFVMPALFLLLLHSFVSDVRRSGSDARDKPNYFSWVRLNRSLTLAALIFLATATLAASAGSAEGVDAWAAFRRGNELLRQAQQSADNASSAKLLEAQQQYRSCLSRRPDTPDADILFENARYNLEMTKLLLAQISGSEPNETRPNEQGRDVNDTPEKRGASPQTQQQQSQEKSESCSMCQTGQNRSPNGRKMKEGGQSAGPATEKSHSTDGSNSSPREEPGTGAADSFGKDKKPEPDARGLFHGETPAEKQTQQKPLHESPGDSTDGTEGMAKKTQPMDPTMQAAVQRLQASIGRIEKRRGQGGNNPESSPEDPANQNRYRDW